MGTVSSFTARHDSGMALVSRNIRTGVNTWRHTSRSRTRGFPMKRSAVVGIQFKPDGLNLEAAVTTVPYSLNWDTKTAHSKGRRAAGRGKSNGISRDHLVVANLLPKVEIYIEV